MTNLTGEAVLERDADVRAEMYRDIQRQHQKESPFVVMFQETVQNGMRENVLGLNTGGPVHDVFYWKVTK
jgi:peptide/nickel transport system substrate-binding protein